ncbi:phosphatase PAP2 family protein [Candidatus Woesearchaeota archaeon]|nr:phosphatase PAP2 family protein [Candidatus Woesearchaeota archaeon]
MIYIILVLVLIALSFFIDKSFSTFIFGFRFDALNIFFKYAYLILKDYLLLIFTSLLLYFSDKKKILSAIFAFLTTGFVILVLKYFINRTRPFEVLENAKLNGFDYGFMSFNKSFPSWHTAAAFSMLPFIFSVDKRLGYFWILVCILIASVRVYAGFHYLSDVLFGGLIGYVIGYLFLKYFKIVLNYLLSYFQ